MDPGVRSHGMKADPPGYLWSKYECFLMSGWWDILHSSCLHVKLWSNSTNRTEVRTNEQTNERTNKRMNICTDQQKDENYIPLGINAGGIISTLWHFRLPLLIQMLIKVASSPRLSGIGMPSLILWSHPLKMQRIVLLSSLLWWELGTNSLVTGPGEWLSIRHFDS